MGSGPGVLGLSAMQVNWLLPWRTTLIFPSDPTSMIVAFFPIASGAADIALLMISASAYARGHIVLLRNGEPGNEKDRTAENQCSLSHASHLLQLG